VGYEVNERDACLINGLGISTHSHVCVISVHIQPIRHERDANERDACLMG